MNKVNKMKFSVNDKTAALLYSSIEKKYNVKFVCVNDSFIYKYIFRKIASKCNVFSSWMDNFMNSFAIYIKVPIKGNLIIIPYRKDDSSIHCSQKIATAIHELQHLIDANKTSTSKWYSSYISNGTFRSVKEARAYCAEKEAMNLTQFNGDLELSKIPYGYILNKSECEIFEDEIENTTKNINNGPSFEASIFFKKFLEGNI